MVSLLQSEWPKSYFTIEPGAILMRLEQEHGQFQSDGFEWSMYATYALRRRTVQDDAKPSRLNNRADNAWNY